MERAYTRATQLRRPPPPMLHVCCAHAFALTSARTASCIHQVIKSVLRFSYVLRNYDDYYTSTPSFNWDESEGPNQKFAVHILDGRFAENINEQTLFRDPVSEPCCLVQGSLPHERAGPKTSWPAPDLLSLAGTACLPLLPIPMQSGVRP